MRRKDTRRTLRLAALLAAFAAATAFAQDRQSSAPTDDDDAPTGSLLARSVADAAPQSEDGEPHELMDSSMFAIAPPKPRVFHQHDLVQIIVRETSKAESTHELETAKKYSLNGKISAWPDIDLGELLQLRMFAGRTTGLPELKLDADKKFTGDGEYKREDDFTARLTAEVVDVLPNGNLILEARTHIKTDEEESTMKVTGVCRPEDVTAANTVLSNQIHDLSVEKMHIGELKKSNEKGLIAQVLDALFAF